MKLTIRYFSFLTIIALSFGGFAHGQKQRATKDLPNFYAVNANLFRGAQPSEEGVRELAVMGVKTIIDLRGADKNSERERQSAEGAGIKFITVDLSNWFKPSADDINEILKDINTPENQPVFVHCKRGADRTGTIVAVYRISHDGWTAAQANEEARKFGFGWWQLPMRDYINDYYRDFKK